MTVKIEGKTLPEWIAEEQKEHQHQWRVIENFYMEHSRTKRLYAFYCVHCLKSQTVEVSLE